jgi:hypothetical protein
LSGSDDPPEFSIKYGSTKLKTLLVSGVLLPVVAEIVALIKFYDIISLLEAVDILIPLGDVVLYVTTMLNIYPGTTSLYSLAVNYK